MNDGSRKEERRGQDLTGRARERAVIDGLLRRVRGAQSAVLVLRGEPGVGKTALMQYCASRADGCRVLQIAGAEAEQEMPFAGLHQLCEPLLGKIDELPEPQQQALRVAFGLAHGAGPDRLVAGVAVLGLLASTAADLPLVCLVDDTQWLDEPTRQVLGFVGRRLLTEPVLLLFSLRESGDGDLLPAQPSLTIEGLVEEDARSLLVSAVPGHLDEHVRDRIVAETRGNPLRLLESSRVTSAAELAGGFGTPCTSTASGRLPTYYGERIAALPQSTRRLLLLAAADPTGDATLLWRAAHSLDLPRSAAAAGEAEQLIDIGFRVCFRHPVARSVAYTSAPAVDRRAAHLALAAATDPDLDPEGRAWHRGVATVGPDESVASELEQAAPAARARGGSAAAAAFLSRSVQLTPEARRRVERSLAAAQAHLEAGALETALGLLTEARALGPDEAQSGRMHRLRGRIQHVLSPGPEAPALLVEAARALEPLDANLAREAYLDAWMASLAAGAGAPADVSKAALGAPAAGPTASPCDLLLDGLLSADLEGTAAGAARLRRAVAAFVTGDVPDCDVVRWGHVATHAACVLWDWDSWETLSVRRIELARRTGALTPLSAALDDRAAFAALCGDFDAAAALAAERKRVDEAIGIGGPSAGEILEAAYQGRAEAVPARPNWPTAILCNGLGRYGDAVVAAERDGTHWALPELIEAAVRSRQTEAATAAVERLAEHTVPDSEWARGIEARCRALVLEVDAAERSYEEAVEQLEQTPFRLDLARAHLLYGEWLRRVGRRVDARRQLATAHELFTTIGAGAFAERARRELVATGQKIRKRDPSTRNDLTAQEAHIARLARDGRSNAEIGAELFLSVRTVEWHLRKVFMKLGVASRKELKTALPLRTAYPSVAA